MMVPSKRAAPAFAAAMRIRSYAVLAEASVKPSWNVLFPANVCALIPTSPGLSAWAVCIYIDVPLITAPSFDFDWESIVPTAVTPEPPPAQLPKLSCPAPSVRTQSPLLPFEIGNVIVRFAAEAPALSVVVNPLPACSTMLPCVLALPTVTVVFARNVFT